MYYEVIVAINDCREDLFEKIGGDFLGKVLHRFDSIEQLSSTTILSNKVVVSVILKQLEKLDYVWMV